MKTSTVLLFFMLFFSYCLAQTVTPQRDLTFGTMLPGVNRTIATTSAQAGKFYISAKASKPFNITFNISDYLTSPGYTLPVIYTASVNASVTDTDPATSFNPKTGTQYTSNRAYVRIGGTLMPSSSQHSGSYSATIIIIVQYVGG